MAWIDLHAHLNMLEEGSEAGVKAALEAGVERIITIGTCPEDHPKVLKLAETYKPHVFGTLGVHPHDAIEYSSEVEQFIRANALNPRIVAIAEIGLDYYYDNSPRETQQEVFRSQLKIAQDLNMPVQIHSRDAEEDTILILKEFAGKVRGVIHCFTGTSYLAEESLKLGYNLSISGVVTFKNAQSLRDIVKATGLDRIHVETDSPFLAPVPQRGKKNTPAYVVHTAEFVAELKGVTIEELAQQTKKNALDMFPKIEWN